MAWMLYACAEWPRYANLPEDSGQGLEPGVVVGEPYNWQPAADRFDEADGAPDPVRAEALVDGVGLLSKESLDGTGWSDQLPIRDTCAEDGTVSGFPPYETGSYTGDLDWWVVSIPGEGKLCGTFAAVDRSVRADVVPYPLEGACSLPGAPLRDAEGNVAGYASEDNTSTWSAPVQAGIYGVVAAGYAPNGEERQLYSWGLAWLPDLTSPCPELDGP